MKYYDHRGMYNPSFVKIVVKKAKMYRFKARDIHFLKPVYAAKFYHVNSCLNVLWYMQTIIAVFAFMDANQRKFKLAFS